jgi:hypothetical protein
MVSRRRLLAAAVAVRFPLSAQRTGNGLAIIKESGLRLARHADPQRPTVALFLPETKYPSVIIEMPEHAWRKDVPGGEQVWFYKMYTSDAVLRGNVKWFNTENALSFEMQTPSGFTLRCKATLETDGVAISYTVIGNKSALQLAELEATTCVKLYRPFTDVFLERTYVHEPEGLDLLASEMPDRIQKNAEEWLPCRYVARVEKNASRTEHRVETVGGVTRYFRSRAVDSAFLATESQPSGWTVATHSINCDAVFSNPARTCHHTNPRAFSVANGRATLEMRVYVINGTPREAWKIIAERQRVGKA